MKQQGKNWIDAEGQSIPMKYVPVHERAAEKVGHKLFGIAHDIEAMLAEKRRELINLCESVLAAHPAPPEKRFTFYVFDKSVKIEYDIAEGYVRVYSATKDRPTSKDYKLLNLDIHSARNYGEGVAIEQSEPEITADTLTPEQIRIEREQEQPSLFDGTGHAPYAADEVGQLPVESPDTEIEL